MCLTKPLYAFYRDRSVMRFGHKTRKRGLTRTIVERFQLLIERGLVLYAKTYVRSARGLVIGEVAETYDESGRKLESRSVKVVDGLRKNLKC